MFIIAKYNGKWAVLDTKTNVYYDIGKGRKHCEKKAEELNNFMKAKNI